MNASEALKKIISIHQEIGKSFAGQSKFSHSKLILAFYLLAEKLGEKLKEQDIEMDLSEEQMAKIAEIKL
jgi:hypothetical protein